MGPTTAQRALIAASLVAVGVAAFVLAYLLLGSGGRDAQRAGSGPVTGPSVSAPRATPPIGPSPGVATATPVTGVTTQSPPGGPWPVGRPAELPPSSVGPLRLESNTMDTFTLAWDAAVDDAGILNYRVLMNGFLADTTGSTRATLSWLGDRSPILIQVAAVDRSGIYGPWSALYVVPPPAPAPSPTSPTSSAAPGPTPSATSVTPTSPTPSGTPVSPSASGTPTVSATPAPPTPSASATPSISAAPTAPDPTTGDATPSASAPATATTPPTATASASEPAPTVSASAPL